MRKYVGVKWFEQEKALIFLVGVDGLTIGKLDGFHNRGNLPRVMGDRH
jgi:hypothetical protein